MGCLEDGFFQSCFLTEVPLIGMEMHLDEKLVYQFRGELDLPFAFFVLPTFIPSNKWEKVAIIVES
ncbi:MAG: hypothetical protein H6573_29185 [Lewinellaceae bacterium]|nr:hypothetical protein [Lewinellaceae bacterium]